MRHVLTFEVIDDDGDTWNYQAMHLDTLGTVQLWYQQPGFKWEIGHSKSIPADMSPEQVASVMREFVAGKIDFTKYNELLPH